MVCCHSSGDYPTPTDGHGALLEPVFRQAEAEFKFFIEKLTELFSEVDPQIPPLPPKDVIYRIYRDVRPNTFLRVLAPFLTLRRFDSAMTRRLTKPTSLRPFREAGERAFSPVVRPCMHHRALFRNNTLSSRSYVRSFRALLYRMGVSLSLVRWTLQNE